MSRTGRQNGLGRRDGNERLIIQAFRQCGVEVWQISQPMDLIVALRGRFHIVEVKDPSQPPSARKLTETEQAFWDATRGYPRHVIETTDQVIDLVNSVVPR